MAKKQLYAAEEISEDKKLLLHWQKELEAERKASSEWRERARKVVKRYRDEEKRDSRQVNILWANTQILSGAVYAQTPKPDVRRRFLDQDPIARATATVLERALSYCMDQYDFDATAESVVNDYLLAAYGTARVRLVPYFQKGEPPKLTVDAKPYKGATRYEFNGEEVEPQFDETGNPYILGEPQDELVYQEIPSEPIPWETFHWDPAAKTWESVRWCAIDHYLEKHELKEQFGDKGEHCALNAHSPGSEGDKEEGEKNRAHVVEIFDKINRRIVVISSGYSEGPLAVYDDPLNLEGFFPFPKPIFGTLTSNKLVPIPEYLFYQDQAEELDRITGRIDKLVDALKVRGIYDQSFKELVDVLGSDDNTLTPVADFAAMFQGKGDLHSVLSLMPLEEIAKVLVALYQARDQLKSTIYEITGISDIVRGQGQASESATAQRIKGQFANMRLNRKQRAVQKFMRDLLRLKAEIICEHIEPEILQLMTGMPILPEMIQIMRSDMMRSFRIDIETDSTVAVDAQEEQKNRVEFLTAVTGFMGQVGPGVAQGIIPLDVAKEMVLFGVRGFKAGRSLEEVIERAAAKPQQPQPNPQQLAMQQEQQQKAMLAQAEARDKAMEMADREKERQHKERMRFVDEQMKLKEMGLKTQEFGVRGVELTHKELEAKGQMTELNAQVVQSMQQIAQQLALAVQQSNETMGKAVIAVSDKLDAAFSQLATVSQQGDQSVIQAIQDMQAALTAMEENRKQTNAAVVAYLRKRGIGNGLTLQ